MTDFRHDQSRAEWRQVFADLPVPALAMRTGFYRARFVGPWWLRWSGPTSVALGGLPGWQGKRFLAPDRAVNVLRRNGRPVERLEMRCVEEKSLIDGRQGVVLQYGVHAPRPWRWVQDELRVLDGSRMLGMTIIGLPGLHRQAFPFLLERVT